MMISRPFPLFARLRYAYYEEERELPILENAWWEGRPDGGFALGCVTEGMGDASAPFRSRVHLRLLADGAPREMMIVLSRPDGEGRADYQFLANRTRTTGEWSGAAFDVTTEMPAGYSVSPRCLSADGLHFRGLETGRESLLTCYHVDPRSPGNPLLGSSATFAAKRQGEELIRIGETGRIASRYSTHFVDAPDKPADFWVCEGRYALRMDARTRKEGKRFQILCEKFTAEKANRL
jgi:hypothetical protein